MEWVAAAIVLALFIYFTRKMLILSGVVVAIVAVLGAYFYYQDWTKEKEIEKVAVIIKFSPDECKEPYPLHIIIGNASDSVVTKVEWDIAVFKPGFSTDISQSGYHEYSEDKILKPKEGWGICARVPELTTKVKNLSSLEYLVKNKYVTFE
ncbi:hypothetical protein WCX18_04155 [Sulfurimonas sp. HSL1-2]|uniref:hypothetical protein n=1 Tax=Thiomicrolovo zhangzhouensis TaxID=3131933 RepID=UPI0031F80B09